MATMTEHPQIPTVQAQLSFARPDQVVDDHEGRDIKRAITRPIDEEFSNQFEYRDCDVGDLGQADSTPGSLQAAGFETVDLSTNPALQKTLGDVRAAGVIEPEQARALRRHLRGSIFNLANGSRLKILSIAPEGLVLRTGGPNGMKVNPGTPLTEMNGHDTALAVHGDQDVRGTPLKQIMRGFAPWLFRHRTPDGSNPLGPLALVNLWIPLQQITRPLALMDRRSLDAGAHQLRYALPTDSFLDRDEDTRENDIWFFLHDKAQRWYFHSEMFHDRAYIFDTLGLPHGSFILPGEAVAEDYYRQLQGLVAHFTGTLQQTSAVLAKQHTRPQLPADTPAALRQAIGIMGDLVMSAPVGGEEPGTMSPAETQWCALAVQAMDSVVRRSLEMRIVGVVLPKFWPFHRATAARE